MRLEFLAAIRLLCIISRVKCDNGFYWRQKIRFQEHALLYTRLNFQEGKKPISIMQGSKYDTQIFGVKKFDYNNTLE